jgi:hypothetical protein
MVKINKKLIQAYYILGYLDLLMVTAYKYRQLSLKVMPFNLIMIGMKNETLQDEK